MSDETRLTRNTSFDATGEKLARKIRDCEPDPEPPEPFVYFTYKVLSVEERKDKSYVDGFGPDATFTEYSLGWYVTFQQQLTIFVGPHKPPLEKGDEVRISLAVAKKAT